MLAMPSLVIVWPIRRLPVLILVFVLMLVFVLVFVLMMVLFFIFVLCHVFLMLGQWLVRIKTLWEYDRKQDKSK
jgi:hypothetical protein